MAVVNNLKKIRESRGLLQEDICNSPYLRIICTHPAVS